VRPRSTVFAALTTTITIGLAGCGQQAASQAPAGDQGLSVTTVVPQADPAARWADGYCGAVTHLVRALAALPVVDPSTPQKASRTSSDLLSSVVGGLDQSLAGLKALGEAKATLDRIDALDYLKGVKDIPALAAAEQRAPACRQLDQPPG
jgi:hypothetical protein